MKWMTRLTWLLLGVDLVLLFPASRMRVGPNAVGAMLMVLWLFLSLFAITNWLIIYYRNVFRHWWAWGAMLMSAVFSSYIVQGAIPLSYPPLELFFALSGIFSVWAVGLSTAFFLWQNDAGLRLLAWTSVAIIWLVAIAWKLHGNLILVTLSSLGQNGTHSPLWWLYPLVLLSMWMIPLALISLIGHTIRIIRHELQPARVLIEKTPPLPPPLPVNAGETNG